MHDRLGDTAIVRAARFRTRPHDRAVVASVKVVPSGRIIGAERREIDEDSFDAVDEVARYREMNTDDDDEA